MQIGRLYAKVKNSIRIAAICAVAALFAAGFWWGAAAQRRGELFQHATAAHKKLSCNSCHKVPTGNSVASHGYPDVADYPGHAACFSCHRADFFAGNKPAICAGCHVNPGPRGVARLPFPVRSRPTQFLTTFPHNVHQDIIASLIRRDGLAVAHYVRASYSPVDDPVPEFNNCAICHQTTGGLPKFSDRGLLKKIEPLGPAAPTDFRPTAAFFKNNPDTHASCFTCHYQAQAPIRTDCAGCHRLAAAHSDSPVITRYSLKFNHQDKDHANKDCTVCHVRITQTADLARMKGADVPILSCSTSSCHGKNVAEETGKRDATIAAKEPAFQCTYCHTPEIGRYPVPASHLAR